MIGSLHGQPVVASDDGDIEQILFVVVTDHHRRIEVGA
jgi:hypothetical protein